MKTRKRVPYRPSPQRCKRVREDLGDHAMAEKARRLLGYTLAAKMKQPLPYPPRERGE